MSAGGSSASELPRLFAQGRYAELEAAARALLADQPRHGGLWKALGVALAAQGRAAEALAAKRQAVLLQPEDPEALVNLGNALQADGQLEAARQSFRSAVRCKPDAVPAWRLLARAALLAGHPDEAEAAQRQVVALQPQSALAHNELGNLLRELHRMHEAEGCYREALRLQPDSGEAHNNLGNTLADLGRVAEAESCYRRALAGQAVPGEVHSNLGNLLKDQGRLPEAQHCYRQAMALAPAFAGAHSNLLLALNHDAGLAVTQTLAEARRFGAALQARAGGPLAGKAVPRAGRPLRVGLASGDLRSHPVGYFLEGWLPHVDPARLVLHAYSTVPREDEVSERLRRHIPHWRSIAGLRDEAAARSIHADGIDVLIDLSGHTAHNALPVFAWRPAPLQASWLGYFATTGLPTMDWLIADATSVPPEHHAHFTERIWTLPDTRLCFAPPLDAPAVARSPVLRDGRITFGCFQALGKINDEVLALWSRVLAAVPTATLRLQNKGVGDPPTRELFSQRLERHGIALERVHMRGHSPRQAYLAAHAGVDVLLDTFPYPGGTTTCEALWMGVPTLTLEGDRMLARQGSALLQAAGLPEWVARSPRDYVDQAVALTASSSGLQDLRSGMRARLPESPLFDGSRFAAAFTAAIEQMHQAACSGG